MKGVNTDESSFLHKTPEKRLSVAERENKHKYLESCLYQWCHFPLFVISVKRLFGTEAEATLKHLSRRLSTK